MKQENLQKTLEALGKSGITVAGDLVIEKNVEYEVNNVEEGGIGIQIINKEQEAKKEKGITPDQLKSNRAKGMMSIAVDYGILDDNWQPKPGVEEWKLACIANKIGEELNLSNKWSVFAQLWSRKPDNLRGLYNSYKDTGNEINFRKKVLNKIR